MILRVWVIHKHFDTGSDLWRWENDTLYFKNILKKKQETSLPLSKQAVVIQIIHFSPST